MDINSIRNVFPKDNAEWLNWISQGKHLYLDKHKIQELIDQQRTNLADVEYLDLDSVTKIVNEFKNPTIPEEKNEENSAKAQYSLQGNSMTEEEQRIADEAKANGTFDASNPDIRYSLATDLNAEVSEGEANPIAEKEVVNVIVDSSEIKLPTNRAEALDVVSKMKRPFINHDQNKEIIVSNKAVRHAATQDKMHKFVDVRCLGVIDKIIENAVKIGNIDVAPDEIETTHKVEVYYCPVKIDDTQYSVRILVRQLKNKGRIWKISECMTWLLKTKNQMYHRKVRGMNP